MIHLSVTCPDADSAETLARAALEARLVACANILPGVRSLFWWEGRIEAEGEVLLIFKTTEGHRPDLVKLIEAGHPYDLPVITWEKVGTTDAAATWLAAETS